MPGSLLFLAIAAVVMPARYLDPPMVDCQILARRDTCMQYYLAAATYSKN